MELKFYFLKKYIKKKSVKDMVGRLEEKHKTWLEEKHKTCVYEQVLQVLSSIQHEFSHI